MNVGIMGIGMFVGYVRLIPIAHLLHIPFRQLYQLPISQPVFRAGERGDMQDGLLRIAVLPAGSSQKRAMPDVCPHWAIPICRKSCGCPKESRRYLPLPCRSYRQVLRKGLFRDLFCNHFRSYSWVSTMTFLHTSISSMLSFSNL